MNETLTLCPVCGGNSFVTERICTDFVATGQEFSLQRCSNCTLLFTNPRPDSWHISPYYQTDKYISHTNSKKGAIYFLYDIVRLISQTNKLKKINERLKNKASLLDVGCGLGYFLNTAKKDGWRVEGLDVSEEARTHVKQHFGIDVHKEEAIKSFPDASFEAITLWHVLEHFHNLQEWVIDMGRVLKTDGLMFVAVPNSDSYDAHHYQSFWDGYDVPRHLYHFNHKSIETLFNKNGLTVVDRLPMIYDSYYISWRSEIHKKSLLGFFMAMIIGQISNWKARKGRNYSSVLYIIKHADK